MARGDRISVGTPPSRIAIPAGLFVALAVLLVYGGFRVGGEAVFCIGVIGLAAAYLLEAANIFRQHGRAARATAVLMLAVPALSGPIVALAGSVLPGSSGAATGGSSPVLPQS